MKPMQPAQSQDEVFDVVDAGDRVVGQATRGEVHARGLLHRAVHIFVMDAAGRFFLQRRSLAKDRAAGLWAGACSGHLDSGEDYRAAAVRELAEEIGVEAGAAELFELGRLDACPETENEFVRIYALRRDGPLEWNPSEIMDGEWVTLECLADWQLRRPFDFAPSFHHVYDLTETALQEWLSHTDQTTRTT